MSRAFEYAFAQTIAREGLYTNNPNDSGGETKFGVTAATWAAYCAELRPLDRRGVRDITLDDAKGVYAHGYWEPLGLDHIADHRISAELFDTAVNCGLKTAAEIAQRAVNLTRKELVAPITVDGRLGPITRQAINTIAAKYPIPLLAALNGFQFERYVELAEKYPKNREFLNGWLSRCATWAMGGAQ